MPSLIKYASVMKGTDVPEHNEIPIEIEIGSEYHFHSLFVCPVSKEISSPDNPPILLRCGHVISEFSRFTK